MLTSDSAYPEMALKQLETISINTIKKFGLHKVAIAHHIGHVPPMESGVIGKT